MLRLFNFGCSHWYTRFHWAFASTTDLGIPILNTVIIFAITSFDLFLSRDLGFPFLGMFCIHTVAMAMSVPNDQGTND